MNEIKNTVRMPILSVSTQSGVSKKSGKDYTIHNIYVMLDDGAVGSLAVFDGNPRIGDIAEVGFGMGRASSSDTPRIVAKLVAIHPATK